MEGTAQAVPKQRRERQKNRSGVTVRHLACLLAANLSLGHQAANFDEPLK